MTDRATDQAGPGTAGAGPARWPGLLLVGVGAAHLLLGVRRYAAELRALPRPVPDAPLWFLTAGLSLVLLGGDVAAVPDAVAVRARRVRGFGVVAIGAAILSQRRRSGAWALLVAGGALALATGTPAAAARGATQPNTVGDSAGITS